MQYQTFFFDLDDTLLDFKKSQEMSFFLTLKNLGLEGDFNALYQDYQIINDELWAQLEKQIITQEVIKTERFRLLFAKHQVEADYLAASSAYLNQLPQTVVLMDGAVSLLDKLSKMGEIGIITNGIAQTQKRRIANSALAPYIHHLVVSDEVGFAKPDPRIFEAASKSCRSFSKARAVMIGDRLEADILGANNFGIDSVWLNTFGKPLSDNITPTFEIRSLNELEKKWDL